MTPQDHKTSVTLNADVYIMVQSIMAQRKDLTMGDAINTAIRFYYDHADDPALEALTAQLATLTKHLETVVTQQAHTLDLDADRIAAVIIAHLDAQRPPPPSVAEVKAPTPTANPQKPRWGERFAKRFGKPPATHW